MLDFVILLLSFVLFACLTAIEYQRHIIRQHEATIAELRNIISRYELDAARHTLPDWQRLSEDCRL